MARKTTTMTKAALQEQFGIPGGPGGMPVKKKQPPKGKFNEKGQVFVNEPPVKQSKGNFKPPVKPEPTLQGPLYITPAVEGQQGKRRAPSLSMDTPTKKGAPARARVDNLLKYGSSSFQSADVEGEDQPAEDLNATGDPGIDTATGEDVRNLAQEIVKTRVDLKLNPEIPNQQTADAEDYMQRMEESIDRRLQAVEYELADVEAQQAGMDECDTSYFTPDQAQYYNDFADYLEERKNDLEYQKELLDIQNPMTKKAPTKKRASSARAKPRPKTRRVAVKRKPVKARRRKSSTSSGRRSPGSPARSR
jgi:hypothetical protein